LSGNPPNPAIKYQIELSTDGGRTWAPLVRDWTVPRRGEEPADFWSQSLCWGGAGLDRPAAGPVRGRFRNDGGKGYARCEAHLVTRVPGRDATTVTFAWSDDGGARQATHTFAADPPGEWAVPTGRGVQTHWVEFEAVAGR